MRKLIELIEFSLLVQYRLLKNRIKIETEIGIGILAEQKVPSVGLESTREGERDREIEGDRERQRYRETERGTETLRQEK